MRPGIFAGVLCAAICCALLTANDSMGNKRATTMAGQQPAGARATVDVGGVPAVFLSAPASPDQSRPHFLEATVLPGFGMNLLQIKAYLPGKGEINILNSPPLTDSKRMLEYGNDEFGNEGFRLGGAILLPYPNRIRGQLSADGKTIETMIDGHRVSLPANWKGQRPGAEIHAMHGLILNAKFGDVKEAYDSKGSSVSAVFHAGDFHGHWLSRTDVTVKISLTQDYVDMMVTAENVGHELLPMAVGFHPYFVFPSGDRAQARLHIPALDTVMVNNYDDVFPRGVLDSVRETPYDFTAPAGATLGNLFLDDCFTRLQHGADGHAVVELIDPAARYGLRIVAISKEIKAVQVYAPPENNFVAVEPQFNLADPFNRKIWGTTDTGVVSLQPGQSVSWHIRIELFIPAS